MKHAPRAMLAASLVVPLAAAAAFAGGCSSTPSEEPKMTREELLDPATCGKCHEDHYREWSGSMHAYAAEDPVFIAMNKRLQRETNGALGDFCIKCHAPMAVKDGLTKDGLNVAELPAKYKGVTCFFCHTTESVGELHNNGLQLSNELVMRGPIDDPVANSAHGSVKSTLHDQKHLDSSKMCGSCHDIVTPKGAHIERTFLEWQQSLFATEKGITCGGCHMKPSSGVQPIANVPGVFARTSHTHTFAGIDRALTPFPNMAEQKAEIEDFLASSLQASLCVARSGSNGRIRVILDNVFAGHSFPSGAAADRRVWVEVIAKDATGKEVYKSGAYADGQPVVESPDDPDLWLLKDRHFDETGKETHIFGHTACYESNLLPFPVTANMADERFYQRNIVRDFPKDAATTGQLVGPLETVSMRVRILPIGLEVIDDLVASGDLDPAIRGRLETMQVGPTLEWKPGIAEPFRDRDQVFYECITRTNQGYAFAKFPPKTENTCK